MTDKRAFYLCLVLSSFLLPACQQRAGKGFQVIRFIDLMKAENIRCSPFLAKAGVKPSPFLQPLKATPLADLGSGENPFLLKRKLEVRQNIMDILFAPPRSEYSFDLQLPEKAVLEFGAGIVRDKNFERLEQILGREAQTVEFRVELQTEAGNKIIFQEQLPVPPRKESRTLDFSLERVNLPSSPQRARLIFQTVGDEGAFAFWHNPVIYTKGRSSRGIILISLDALRPDHLGCYGYQRPTSPNIDALAEDSVLFESAHSTSNWTLPTHVSLLTSLWTSSHQVYTVRERINSSTVLLAEVPRQCHFFCAAFTGASLLSSFFGFSRGFDTYRQREEFISYENSAELVSKTVLNWLDKNKDKDFFLFIHTYQMHDPYVCPAPYNAMFLEENSPWAGLNVMKRIGGRDGAYKALPEKERNNIIGLYDGEVRYTDEMLVRPLVAKLRELSLYDQTMIVLTSDHGDEFCEHGAWLHSINLYEESLRVPLIIKFPASEFGGRRIRSLVRSIDVMPTVLEAVGLKTDKWRLDGRSLFPVVRGKEKKDRMMLADSLLDFYSRRPQEEGSSKIWLPDKIAFGTRKRKLLFNQGLSEELRRFFSPPPPQTPTVELYDLEVDPGEKVNLALREPRTAGRMLKEIQEIYKKAGKRRPDRVKINEALKEQLRALGYIR